MSISGLDSEVNDVANWIRGLAQKLQGLAGNAIIGVIPGVGDLVRSLRDAANTILQKILNIGSHVKDQIGTAVGSLVPSAIQFLSAIVGGIGNDIHWLLNNLATAEQFAAGFVGEAAKHFPGIGTILSDAVSGGLGSGLLGILKFLEGQEPEMVDGFLRQILKTKSLPPFLAPTIRGLISRGAEWQIIPIVIIVGLLITPFAEAFTNPALVEAKQTSNLAFRTQALPPESALEAVRKGAVNPQRYYDELGLGNLDKERADILYRASLDRLQPEVATRSVVRGQMPYPAFEQEMLERGITKERAYRIYNSMLPLMTEEDLRSAYLRGLLSETEHDTRLAHYGYDQSQINFRKQLYFYIPGPDDLIRMAIRDVFTPEIVQKFDLFANFPPQFEQFAKMQGISKDWALRHWGSHWVVPSNTEAFEMFQRTIAKSEDENADTFTLSDGTRVQNVIGRSTLAYLLRQKDIAPYWRQKFTDVAYNPYTRIDLRRMHRVGVLTHAQVQRGYLDLGYNFERATNLANFVEKLNSQEAKDQYANLINGLSRRILTYYGQGKLDRIDADTALHDLGLTDDEIGFYLVEEDMLREADTATQIEAGVGKLYTGDLITRDDATKRLKTAGVTDLAITRLFAKWDLALEFKDLKAEHVVARDLTKSEILSAVREKLMTDDDARPMLQNLGYDPAEVEIELALAKYQEQKQTTQSQIDALKALYVNGVREPLDVSNSLDALGLNTIRRDSLLSEWQLQREQRTEKIPQATIRDMVIARYISEDDALIQLKRHRLSDADASLLLQFWLQKTQPRR